MAAKSSFNTGPWNFRPTELEQFVRVTPENRPNAAILGRILYIIDGKTYRGHIVLQPAYKKGLNWIQWKPWDTGFPNQYSVFINESIDEVEWVKVMRMLVSKFINEGTLFIRPTDPILKFNYLIKA